MSLRPYKCNCLFKYTQIADFYKCLLIKYGVALPRIAPAASLIVWQQYETFKVGLSPSKKKKIVICFNDSPTKIIKNVFLLHIKSSFHSQDISIFVLIFLACIKNSLNRKTGLTSKFMMSQPGQQRITTYILLNISRIKCNETMKFG